MATLTAKQLPRTSLLVACAIILALLALTAFSVLPAFGLLVAWISLGGIVGLLLYAVQGDLLIAFMVWMVTLIALHEEFWRMPVPLFFAVTIPRLGIVVLVGLLLVMIALGRIQPRHAWPASALIVALAVYFFLSAVISGFETRSVVSVHYRLIGGYIFPFATFAVILHAFNNEWDFRRLAVFFALLSVYLTFTGWCEQFGLYGLVFPQFIGDPSVGIHFGRVRGPFVMSPAMGLALVYCYFSNLVLARNIRRGRIPLYLLNAAILPTIFWTKTRSVWLAFVFCSLIWAMYSRRRTTRVISVSLLLAAGLLIGVINMDNFLSENRAKGGFMDVEPLLLRVGLAQMSWEIVKQHPLFGIGFGHFRDYAPAFAKDPSSPFYAFGTTALEHNNLLSIVAETGLVGLILYLAVAIALLRFSIDLYRKLPPRGPGFISRDLLVLYWILATAYFIDGTFRETSDNPFANSLFFGLSAIPVALNQLLSPAPIRLGAELGPFGYPGGRPGVPRGPRRDGPIPARAGASWLKRYRGGNPRGRPAGAGPPAPGGVV